MIEQTESVALIGAEHGRAFGLDRLLATAGYSVRPAADDAAASSYQPSVRADAIVVASSTADAPPRSMISVPRSAGRETPIMILAPWAPEVVMTRSLSLTSDRCMIEPFAPGEFIARLKALIQDSTPDSDEVDLSSMSALSFGDIQIDVPACLVTRRGVEVPLTTKEFDLLLALIQMRGAIASRSVLLQKVWGYKPQSATRTVDIHIAELRRKLENVPSEPRYLVTVRKRGYRFAAHQAN